MGNNLELLIDPFASILQVLGYGMYRLTQFYLVLGNELRTLIDQHSTN